MPFLHLRRRFRCVEGPACAGLAADHVQWVELRLGLGQYLTESRSWANLKRVRFRQGFTHSRYLSPRFDPG